MYKEIFVEETIKKRKSIPVCDFCKREVYENYNTCPSEAPLINIFVGYDTYSPMVKYGVDMGDMCVNCRENWFEDLLKTYPHAKRVKYND